MSRRSLGVQSWPALSLRAVTKLLYATFLFGVKCTWNTHTPKLTPVKIENALVTTVSDSRNLLRKIMIEHQTNLTL